MHLGLGLQQEMETNMIVMNEQLQLKSQVTTGEGIKGNVSTLTKFLDLQKSDSESGSPFQGFLTQGSTDINMVLMCLLGKAVL